MSMYLVIVNPDPSINCNDSRRIGIMLMVYFSTVTKIYALNSGVILLFYRRKILFRLILAARALKPA